MKCLTMIAAGIWLAAVTHASAIEPSFDCAKADSDAEEAVCTNDALAELDLELARLYKLAIDGPHMTAGRKAKLKTTQRGWIKGRNECWKSRLGIPTCVANAYAFRIHEIRTGYSDARSDDAAGKSVGPFALACEGLDAGVSAIFINTAEPLVSLSWLENAIVLPRVMSASGANYEADYWNDSMSMLWTKGNEAKFIPPGGREYSCRIEEIG